MIKNDSTRSRGKLPHMVMSDQYLSLQNHALPVIKLGGEFIHHIWPLTLLKKHLCIHACMHIYGLVCFFMYVCVYIDFRENQAHALDHLWARDHVIRWFSNTIKTLCFNWPDAISKLISTWSSVIACFSAEMGKKYDKFDLNLWSALTCINKLIRENILSPPSSYGLAFQCFYSLHQRNLFCRYDKSV